MLESIIAVIMAGVFAFLVQPPIAEVGVYAGPYWPEAGDSELIRTTTGVTAYTPLSDHLGVEFGAAYTQSGYAWHCPWPCFDWNKPRDEGRTLRDYIDASALVQARIPATDRASLRLLLGPAWSTPVRCRSKNLTRGTEGECTIPLGDSRLRVIAGAGVAYRMTRHLGVIASYRFSVDPQTLAAEEDGSGSDIASSLTMAVTYHR